MTYDPEARTLIQEMNSGDEAITDVTKGLFDDYGNR